MRGSDSGPLWNTAKAENIIMEDEEALNEIIR